MATIADMHSRWRRAAAAICVALLGLVLAGCDVSGTVVAQSDETLTVDLVVSASDLGVSQDGSPCPAQINALTVTPQPTATGAEGCRITGTVRASEYTPAVSVTTVGEYHVLRLNLQSEDAIPAGEVDVTVRFPGDVLQASGGQVEGNSVRITKIRDLTGLSVIALNRPGPPDRVIWGVAGAVGTLLVVGALWLVLRRRQPAPVVPAAGPTESDLQHGGEPAIAPTSPEPIAPEPASAAPAVDPSVHDHSLWAPPDAGRGPVD